MNAHIDLTNVVLKTKRLTLRPFKLTDLDDFFEYASVPGVGEMAGWPYHKNKEESLYILNKFIQRKRTFALVYENKVIGSLGLEEYNEDNFTDFNDKKGRAIGYVLSKKYWGLGLMPEAVKEVIRFAFDELKLDFLTIGHFIHNNQSARVIEKCGFNYYKTVIQQRLGEPIETKSYILFNDNNIKYRKPLDFDESWKKWIKEVNDLENKVEISDTENTKYGKLIHFYFDSVKNTKVYARLYYNNESIKNNLPLIIFYHGFNGKSSDDYYIKKSMFWVEAGFSVLMMDCRNQGGLTIDNNEYTLNDRTYAVRGILDKETVYDKLLYQDALKLLMISRDKTLEPFQELSNMEVVILGPSQGGQIALAVASLSDIPILCLPDIPSGCAIISRIEKRQGKYSVYDDIIKDNPKLKETIYHNISYTDIINFADKIKSPVFSSVGSSDEICPMEYYLKAHNTINSEKKITYYEGYGHGGFDKIHFPLKVKYIKSYINKGKDA